jgi:riboflavin kinase
MTTGSRSIDADQWKQLFALYKLAEMGAHHRTIKVSTEYFAQKMNMSQQTASRYLIQLERKGWIKRAITPEGCLIRIASAGMNQLDALHANLRIMMEAKHPASVTLEGAVFTGIGEGAYYITKEGYRKQFIERLGYDPYPGTLNIKLTNDYDMKARAELEAYPAIEIQAFKNENRTYGPVKCYPALINNRAKGAILFALRTHYDSSVIEIIAPNFLRQQLKLRDGQKIKIEAFTMP